MSSEIKKLIEIVYDPKSKQEDKNKALQVLDQFKNENKNILNIGAQLIDKENTDHVRFYALKLIEHYIKFSWNFLSIEEQSSLRMTLIGIIKGDLLKKSDESTAIKKKIASLIVEIMKRQWPQLWMAFFDDLYLISQLDDFRMELCVLILTDLFIQINNNVIYPITRKKEITNALATKTQNIMQILIQALEQKEFLMAGQSDVLTLLTIKCFSQFFDLVFIKNLKPDEQFKDLIKKMIFLLKDDKYSFDVLNCLCSLSNLVYNKYKKSLSSFSSCLFDDYLITMLVEFSSIFSDNQVALKGALLMRYLTLLSTYSNMSLLLVTYLPDEKYSKYVEVLTLSMIQCSTRSIGRYTKLFITSMNNIFQSNNEILKSPIGDKIITNFIENSYRFFLDKPKLLKIDSLIAQDENQIHSIYTNAKNNMIRLTEIVSTNHPNIAVKYFLTTMANIYSYISSKGLDSLDIDFIGVCMICQTIFQSLINCCKSVYLDLAHDDNIRDILFMMLNYDGKDIYIKELCTLFLSTFIFTTFDKPQFLKNILEFFIKEIFICTSDELNNKDFVGFNSKAIKRFNHIFKLYSREIYNLDDSIIQILISSVYEFIWKMDINRVNLVHVVESIVLLINESPDVMFQKQALREILQPIYLFFDTKEIYSSMHDPLAFLKTFSIKELDQDAQNSPIVALRNKLNISLEIISSINRKSYCSHKSGNKMFGPTVIIEFIPYLLNLAVTLKRSIFCLQNVGESIKDNKFDDSLSEYISTIYILILNIFADILDIDHGILLNLENGLDMFKKSFIDEFDKLSVVLIQELSRILFDMICKKVSNNQFDTKNPFTIMIVPIVPKLGMTLKLHIDSFQTLYFQDNPSPQLLEIESKEYSKISLLSSNFTSISLNILYNGSMHKKSQASLINSNAFCIPMQLKKIILPMSDLFNQILTNDDNDPQAIIWLKEQINIYFFMLSCDYLEISQQAINLIGFSMFYLFSFNKITIFSENEWLDLFACLIKSLEKHGKEEIYLDNYIMLTSFVYANIDEKIEIYKKLQNIETISKENLEKFNISIKTNSILNKSSEKTLKNHFKRAFDSHISKSILETSRLTDYIKNIAQNSSNLPNINSNDNIKLKQSQIDSIENFKQMSDYF